MIPYRTLCAVALIAVLTTLAVGCAAVQDSGRDLELDSVPRTGDARPDFSGIWQSRILDINNFTLEQEERTSASRAENPGAGLPYSEEAMEQVRQFTEADDPMLHCIPRGLPRQIGNSSPFQIVQTPDHVIILYEAEHRFRIIPTDGRPHPDDWYPTFMGDSVGHWDGDTLVVDVIGFNDATWLDTLGTFHSEDLHIVERYRLVDASTLEYEATVEDPNVLTEPWVKTVTLMRRPPEDRIRESICVDTQDAMYFREVFGSEPNQ